MERIEANASQPLKILVATSGDTGGAVAAAFHGRSNVEVDIFYPAGQVSARQVNFNLQVVGPPRQTVFVDNTKTPRPRLAFRLHAFCQATGNGVNTLTREQGALE